MLLSTLDSIFDLLTVLFILAVVLVMTYFTTRFIAGYQKGKSVGRNIEVVETYKITSGKYIQIVKAGEKYLVIAIGKNEIHALTELSPEEINILPPKESSNLPSFKELLEKVKSKKDKDQ